MRCLAPLMSVGMLIALPAGAEPVEVFGGDVPIGDGFIGLSIDVDGDLFDDINFAYFGISVNSIFAWDGVVREGSGISSTQFAAVLDGNERFVHPRFMEGDMIGAGTFNGSSSGAIAYEVFFDGTSGGDWLDQERGYVAFSFMGDVGTRLHYGWAEVSISHTEGTDDGFLIVHRIGYETLSDTPIQAGAPSGCSAADLNGDGSLDFFDVSAFLSAFAAMDPVADFNGDTVFDFFDVSAFLGVFAAGCP